MKFKTAYAKQPRAGTVNEEPSLTKQSFKDECDINKILRRFQTTGAIAHAHANQAYYDEIPELDYLEAMNITTKANQMFESLPSSLRAKFENKPEYYLAFVQDPDNEAELIKLGLAHKKPKKNVMDVSEQIPPAPAASGAKVDMDVNEAPNK